MGYTDEELPTQQTINTKLNRLGYRLTRVAKCRPQKKVPQTDAIFEQLSRVNPQADKAPDVRRLSLDAQAAVHLGPFSRRGRSGTKTKAADHDFEPEVTLTPFGIFLPEYDDLSLSMARSKVTSDFIPLPRGHQAGAQPGQRTGEPQPPDPVPQADGRVRP
jgi:hypothetical protein